MAKKTKYNYYHVKVKNTGKHRTPGFTVKPSYHQGIVEAKTEDRAKEIIMEIFAKNNFRVMAEQEDLESLRSTIISIKKLRSDFIFAEPEKD